MRLILYYKLKEGQAKYKATSSVQHHYCLSTPSPPCWSQTKWHTLMPALASPAVTSAINRHDGQAMPITACAREGSWDWEGLGTSIPHIQKERHTDKKVTLILTLTEPQAKCQRWPAQTLLLVLEHGCHAH